MDYQARPELTERERLILIEEMLGSLKQDLFGNGQPGFIAEFQSRIANLEMANRTRDANSSGQKTVWGLLLVIVGLGISVIGLLIGKG